MQLYIGITGFTRPGQVTKAVESFPRDKRKLMVGVLQSQKSLRGVPTSPYWTKRIPPLNRLSSLFGEDDRAFNLVHYCAESEADIVEDMLKIRNWAGPNFHGFQLNIAWPEIQEIEDYRAREQRYSLILQIGPEAIRTAGSSPKGVVTRLREYIPFINGILLDSSQGRNIPPDVDWARSYLREIRDMGWDLSLGLAGALGPGKPHPIKAILEEFPDLNWDAESGLRNSENDLDLSQVLLYVKESCEQIREALKD